MDFDQRWFKSTTLFVATSPTGALKARRVWVKKLDYLYSPAPTFLEW